MQDGPLADHVENTVAAIAEVHRAHYRHTTPHQRQLGRATALLARPAGILVLGLVMLIWMLGNLAAQWSGRVAWDPPPFAWLELTATLFSAFLATMILATQRRDDELATQRAQLTLQLALLNERKSTKIIALVEELRTDSPGVTDRVDREASAMAQSADPNEVLAAIEKQSESDDKA